MIRALPLPAPAIRPNRDLLRTGVVLAAALVLALAGQPLPLLVL